jgi:hypothetical protein
MFTYVHTVKHVKYFLTLLLSLLMGKIMFEDCKGKTISPVTLTNIKNFYSIYNVCMYVLCVRMDTYLCAHMCVLVRMYVYVCVYMCMRARVFMCVHACVYVYVYVRACICFCMCVRVCAHVRARVYMFVFKI